MTDQFCLDQISQDGMDKIYKKLKELYRSEFSNDYKLLVTYNSDIINNPEYPGQYLNEFVRVLKELNFPTFFVRIKTSYSNIARDLKHLKTIYNNRNILIIESEEEFCAVTPTADTFCVLPWMHFYFNPQGQINPCCMADVNYPLDTYVNSPIDFNSPNIIKFRQTLLDNYQAPQCTICYKAEQNNLISSRQANNKMFQQYIPKIPTAIVDNFKLRYVDVRLNNVCNLKCRMCSGKFSSKIAEEDYRIWGFTDFLQNSNNTEQEEKIIKLIAEQINNLEKIYFAGGEPLVNDTHYKILDLLLKNNRTDIKIFYNTNFSLLSYKKHNVLEYWKQFTNITIGASIDLIGPESNYVRNGVEYAVLENNYYKLIKECSNVFFTITSVLSLYNAFNLCNLQQHWINNIGFSVKHLSFTLLSTPEHLSIRVLPTEIKLAVTDRVNKHIDFLLTVPRSGRLIRSWQQAITYMNDQDDSHLLPTFFKLGDSRDKVRNQKFENYFPEYKNLRSYVDLGRCSLP